MTRDELAAALYRASHLTGMFTLRSGKTSTEYFDKYQFTSRPELLGPITDALADLLPPDVEVLAGLEMGGIPLAAALAIKTGLPAVYVRKERKTYGTCRLTEGVDVAGKRLAVIEDVVTTGGQIVISTGELRAGGAEVPYALAVLDREMGGHAKLGEHGLDFRAVFTAAQLEDAAARPE